MAIIFSLVGAGYSHWIWISGADPAVPGITSYSYDFKLGPLQPEVNFVRQGKQASSKQKNKKESTIVRGFKSVADMGGQALVGELSGSRAYMWADVINGVSSYSDLNKKVCGGDMGALLRGVTGALTGQNDCGSIHTLQYMSIGSMLFLALGVLFAVLGIVQHFTGKVVSYAWENVFAFSVAASCAVVMIMQICAAVTATGLMYEGRWFKFIPYFGMFWNFVAFVLSFVIVAPCCNDRQALLLKDDEVHEAPQQGQYQQGGQYPQGGQYQQGGQYGAYGQYPQQGPGYGPPPGQGQYSQDQARGAYY